MTKIPGTHFTKEQLSADLRIDKIMVGNYSGTIESNYYGQQYSQKAQYTKAFIWFLSTALKNSAWGCSNTGEFYHFGIGLPTNYLCGLKWYLKAAKGNTFTDCFKYTGILFEHGQGVPVDKLKSLEWYYHSNNKDDIGRLENQGFYRSEIDKKKSIQQLITETEAILDAEKKKLEEKQFKTRKDLETLEQLNIVYKLADGNGQFLKDKYILMSGDKRNDAKSADEDQAKHLKSEINTKDNKISSLENEIQGLKTSKLQIEDHANAKIEQLNTTIAALAQTLKSKNTTVEVSHGTSEMVQILNRLLESKSNEIELLKQNTAHQLEKEKKKNDALKQEIKRLKQESKSPQQTVVQSSRQAKIGPSYHDDFDDPYNDINYDSESENTGESGDDIN